MKKLFSIFLMALASLAGYASDTATLYGVSAQASPSDGWTNSGGYYTQFLGSATSDAQTVLLLSMEDRNTGKYFYDRSLGAHGYATVHNSAAVSTAQAKFGAASYLGSGSTDALSYADGDSWDLGTVWTIDFWVYFNAVGAWDTFCSHGYLGGVSDTVGWNMSMASTSQLSFMTKNSGTASYDFAWTPSTGQWYHVAMVSDSAKLHLFIDGSEIGSGVVFTEDLNFGTQIFTVGSPYDLYPGRSIDGYIDEFRLSKGVARWTANFTPPTDAWQ